VSGVFLYVGIVAIWAFVLVPRWLRRHHSQSHAEAELVESAASEDHADAEHYEPYADAGAAVAQADADDADPEASDHRDGHSRQAAGIGRPAAAPPRRSHLPPSRARMLQARRRLLTGLLLLAAAMGGCIEAKLIPVWACIPPAMVLAAYLLLLREVGRAETEQAHNRAASLARAQAARRHAEVAAAAAAQPSAQIIDISGRVGDQLYDQYADATVRAVGD